MGKTRSLAPQHLPHCKSSRGKSNPLLPPLHLLQTYSIHPQTHLHPHVEPIGSWAYRQAGSHAGKGWESFTAAILKTITSRHTSSGETTPEKGVVLMAWGKHAQNMVTGVDKVCLLFSYSHHSIVNKCRPGIPKRRADFPENKPCPFLCPPISFRSYERFLWEWAFQSSQYVVGREIWA
jgi:hypothetical protein